MGFSIDRYREYINNSTADDSPKYDECYLYVSTTIEGRNNVSTDTIRQACDRQIDLGDDVIRTGNSVTLGPDQTGRPGEYVIDEEEAEKVLFEAYLVYGASLVYDSFKLGGDMSELATMFLRFTTFDSFAESQRVAVLRTDEEEEQERRREEERERERQREAERERQRIAAEEERIREEELERQKLKELDIKKDKVRIDKLDKTMQIYSKGW